MTPLLGYRLGLLLRSTLWLPPFLLWLVIVVVGSVPGQSLTEATAYNSMALVPATAWVARSLLLAEPDASRSVLVAARGAVRVHLASLLAAVLAGAALTLLGVAAAVGTAGTGGLGAAPLRQAATTLAACVGAGLTCVLVGVAAGALCTTTLERRAGFAIPTTALLAVVAVIASGSPAQAAITSVPDVPRPDATSTVVLALGGAALLVCVSAAFTSWWSRSRQ